MRIKYNNINDDSIKVTIKYNLHNSNLDKKYCQKDLLGLFLIV